MEHLFYLFVAIFIVWEAWKFIEIDYVLREIRIYKKLKAEKDFRGKNVGLPMQLLLLIDSVYMVFTVAGLFTSQGVGFLPLMILSLFPHNTKVWRRVDSVLSILILLAIILNKYLFHFGSFNFKFYINLFQ